MYISPNYKTKKQIKEALNAGVPIRVFEPGVGQAPVNGPVDLEGPHSPEPHTWYAEGVVEDGRLVKIK